MVFCFVKPLFFRKSSGCPLFAVTALGVSIISNVIYLNQRENLKLIWLPCLVVMKNLSFRFPGGWRTEFGSQILELLRPRQHRILPKAWRPLTSCGVSTTPNTVVLYFLHRQSIKHLFRKHIVTQRVQLVRWVTDFGFSWSRSRFGSFHSCAQGCQNTSGRGVVARYRPWQSAQTPGHPLCRSAIQRLYFRGFRSGANCEYWAAVPRIRCTQCRTTIGA